MKREHHALVAGEGLWLPCADARGTRDDGSKLLDAITQVNSVVCDAYRELPVPAFAGVAYATRRAALSTSCTRALPIEAALRRPSGNLDRALIPLLDNEGVPRHSMSEADKWDSIVTPVAELERVLQTTGFLLRRRGVQP